MPTSVHPGPRDWTFGPSQLRKIKQDVLGYYTGLHRRYGDVVYLRLGPYRTYVFFHPDAVRDVLVAKARQFRRFPRPLQVLAQWNANSVLISEGDEWLRQRRMVQPAFHPRRFDRYASCMVARTRDCLGRWLKTIDSAGSIEAEVGKEMTDLTLEIIGKTMFDAEVRAEASALGRAVAVLSEFAVKEMESPWTLPDWLPLPGKRRKRWAMRRLARPCAASSGSGGRPARTGAIFCRYSSSPPTRRGTAAASRTSRPATSALRSCSRGTTPRPPA
jgi:cytochrome P450